MSSALNVTSSLGSLPGSWGSVMLYQLFFIIIPLAVFGLFIAVLWSFANYTRARKYLHWIFGSIPYFFIGIATTGICSMIGGVLWYGYSQAKEGNTVPIRYAFYILGGYAFISFVGWIVKRFIVDRVVKFEKLAKRKNVGT